MRLTRAATAPVGRPITIDFEGRVIASLSGETVAAALSAAGIVAFRHTSGGAPRGLHCGMGACFDCVVTIDGRIGQRACLTTVGDGMRVSGGVPDSLAEPEPLPNAEDAVIRVCDVLVVGAGPAGLSGARSAAEVGANVVLLDERGATGGQYLKPMSASHLGRRPDAQFRLGNELREAAKDAGVTIKTNAIVWGAFAFDEIAAVIDGHSVIFRPRRLILATGAHEYAVPLPGWTLPGVMTTGGLQGLVRTQMVSPGQRVLVGGNGPLNLQLACELLDAGITVVAVAEVAARPGFAAWAPGWALLRADPALAWRGFSYLLRLLRAGVAVYWGSRVIAVDGEGRVEGAQIETPAGTRQIKTDIVALNMGFQPENGLARALDVAHRFVDVGLGHLATQADVEGRTTHPAIFAIGDGAALGGARIAQLRGALAGFAAARDLGFGGAPDTRMLQELRSATRFQAALWEVFKTPRFDAASLADATIVCRCEEVTAGRLRLEIANGLASLAALKKATRAGMGRCQGRFCAATVARLCPGDPDEDAFAAPRLPVRPVPAAPLMTEAPEFEAPLIVPVLQSRRVPVHIADYGMKHCDVLVIGGGCVGLSCANYLAQEGADVVLAERDEAGLAASTANAGSLHVQLLSYDFTDATPADGGPAGRVLPLGPRSIALWRHIALEAGETLGLSTPGGLMLAENETDLPFLRAKSALEARCGVETHVIGANELRRMAPHLSERLAGAVFCPGEGRIDPLRGTAALAKLALKKGCRLLRCTEVQAVERRGGTWHVSTSTGVIVAGRVVNAAGPWAAQIGALVGLDLPVTGTVQQVIVTEPAPLLVEHLVAVANRHLSLKQQDSGGLLIGGGWFGAYDRETGRSRNLRRNLQGNLWVAARALPALRNLSIIRSWTGINVAIDRAPIMGEVPTLPGFFNAVTANGYTLAPVVGQMTADALLHGTKIDPGFTMARFS